MCITAYPPDLFESCTIMRQADKAQLAHAIMNHVKKLGSEELELPETQQNVLDGGSLLHRITWRKGETYEQIAKSYADFRVRRYGKAIVVFDG